MTIRNAGAVTAAITGTEVGGVITVRGPYGTRWPIDLVAGRDVLFVAGGLGLAPLRSAVFAVAEDSTERGSVGIVYGAKTPEDMLFKGDLEIWGEMAGVAVHLTVDTPSEEWTRGVGLVTAPFDEALESVRTPLVMMCGPDIMMIDAGRDLVARDIDPSDIWVTLERNMKCAVGLCGHCQLGPLFVCKDGPVFRYDRVAELLEMREA